MKNKLWAIILVAALLFALSPLPASTVARAAAVPLTKLHIGSDTPVTLPGNGRYTYGGNAGGAGTTATALPASGWTWYVYNDHGAYTLTLRGAYITTAGDIEMSWKVGIFADGDLDIRLDGASTVDVSGFSAPAGTRGVCSGSGSIRVTGDGNDSLTAKGSQGGLFAQFGDIALKDADVVVDGGIVHAIFAGIFETVGSVSVTGGSLNATGLIGIIANGAVTLTNAKTTLTGRNNGLDAYGDVIVNGGSLDVTGTRFDGVEAKSFTATNAVVTVSGPSSGISADSVSLTGSTLIARSDRMALSRKPLILDAYLWKASDRNADPGGALTSSATRPYPYSEAHRYVYITPPAPPKTGDGAPVAMWAALTALGVGGAMWMGRKRRTREP